MSQNRPFSLLGASEPPRPSGCPPHSLQGLNHWAAEVSATKTRRVTPVEVAGELYRPVLGVPRGARDPQRRHVGADSERRGGLIVELRRLDLLARALRTPTGSPSPKPRSAWG